MAEDTEEPSPAAPGLAEDRGGGGDTLPEDLDVTAYQGQYRFPDIRRRRIAAWMYVALGALSLAAWGLGGPGAVLSNAGFGVAGVFLVVVAAYHFATAWPLAVREGDALEAAAGEVGFAVGHASAQLGWQGLRSRPAWRILLYSSEEPPTRRGLVLVDAVDGRVLHHFVEQNPEDWSAYDK